MLLDLREQWEALTCGKHPLGRPAVVPVVRRVVEVKPRARRDRVPRPRVEGVDWWMGSCVGGGRLVCGKGTGTGG